jgi:hypothetical protein
MAGEITAEKERTTAREELYHEGRVGPRKRRRRRGEHESNPGRFLDKKECVVERT